MELWQDKTRQDSECTRRDRTRAMLWGIVALSLFSLSLPFGRRPVPNPNPFYFLSLCVVLPVSISLDGDTLLYAKQDKTRRKTKQDKTSNFLQNVFSFGLISYFCWGNNWLSDCQSDVFLLREQLIDWQFTTVSFLFILTCNPFFYQPCLVLCGLFLVRFVFVLSCDRLLLSSCLGCYLHS